MLAPPVVRSEVDEQLSFGSLIRSLRRNRLTLLIATAIFTVSGAIAAWVQQPVYKATVVFALVAPPFSEQSGSLEGGLSSLGGALGRVAGLNLSSTSPEFLVNLAVLQSRDLLRDYLVSHHLMELVLEASRPRWNFGGSHSVAANPEDAVQYFRDKVRSITPEVTPGVYRLEIEWYNPRQAAEWANSILEFANAELRETAAARSSRRLEFLTQRLKSEQALPIQDVLSRLIAEETKTLALTVNVDAYAFRVIDQAYVPSRRAKPQRTLITLLAAVSGLVVTSLFILARDSSRGLL